MSKFLLLGVFAVIILILLSVFIALSVSHQKNQSKSPNNSINTTTEETGAVATEAGVALVNKWLKLAKTDSGELSIQYIDLTDNQALGYEEKKIYEGASVNKLITAGYLLSQFDKGAIDLRENLGDVTLQEHARLMVNQSNNNSWQTLNDRLGYANIENFALGLGMSDFQIENNEISVHDTGIFLEKLYKGQVLTEASKQLLYSWMRNTETEDRIPFGLPPNTVFYHKSGTFEKGIHDAAIIVNPKRPFVIIVFTNGVKDGRAIITEITRDAWAYADSKPQ